MDVTLDGSGHFVQLRNTTRNTDIASNTRIATGFFQRARGLMFERELPPGSALIIDPCGSIHMFFMRFPLDVLYVSRDHRVVRVQEGIRPWRVGPIRTPGAHYVVELPVGAVRASRTEVGDALEREMVTEDNPASGHAGAQSSHAGSNR